MSLYNALLGTNPFSTRRCCKWQKCGLMKAEKKEK